MILRSHAKGNEPISATGGQRESDVDLEGTSGTEKGLVGEQLTVPSDRDFYEYMPARLPFYNKERTKEETDYPFETFTHQAYCTLVYGNRMSVKQAMNHQDEKKELKVKRPSKPRLSS
jgi:hypothetical protein